MVDKIKKVLDRTILSVASFLLIILVIGALWQVFSRYVLSTPSTFTNELLGFLLVWTSLLGASYAFGSNQHLAITFFRDKFKGKRKQIITMINDLFILFFAIIVLIDGGMDAVSTAMTQTTPILGITTGYVYLIVPITGAIIVLYKLLEVRKYFNKQENEGDL
ncbi:TRAP transporter small permease [Gracilibacillus sp. YIM 98692]|uniref:TRAP transporter small permease n=1 Tax=Gracilibacillus sp. YIM 98692 TaxID=2663532 RepID=UPI0013D77094|nr:TRAP transporter small permease [Gracilibacillus sp. YIM 98692]